MNETASNNASNKKAMQEKMPCCHQTWRTQTQFYNTLFHLLCGGLPTKNSQHGKGTGTGMREPCLDGFEGKPREGQPLAGSLMRHIQHGTCCLLGVVVVSFRLCVGVDVATHEWHVILQELALAQDQRAAQTQLGASLTNFLAIVV